jgi:hypothetical protein
MSNGYRRQTLVWLALFSIGCVGAANAQGRFNCRSPLAPSIGMSAGRSSPYLEPASAMVPREPNSYVSVSSGAQLAGHADVPMPGPLRLRLEAARSRWDVRRTVYDPAAGYAITSDRSIGSMSERHLVALIGMNTTWLGPCAYVAAGGGFYSIGFRDTTLRSPGVALATGLEIPTGAGGAVQLGAALHVINSGNWRPITTNSQVLSFDFLAGWAYRF